MKKKRLTCLQSYMLLVSTSIYSYLMKVLYGRLQLFESLAGVTYQHFSIQNQKLA